MYSLRYMVSVCKQKQVMLLSIMVFNTVPKYQHCNMLLRNKNKAVIKNLYQLKEYSLQRILTECLKTNCKRKGLGILLKKIWETQSTDQRHKAADRNTCITEENETTVDELLNPVSQEDQKQTSFNTPDTQRDGSNTV